MVHRYPRIGGGKYVLWGRRNEYGGRDDGVGIPFRGVAGGLMNRWTRWFAVAAAVLTVNFGLAQAPAGSTGQCKDGTYTTTADRSAACRGHKGVQSWYASAPLTVPAPVTAPTKTPVEPPKALPDGGVGLVWVNTVSKIYHCPGTKYYGKTKEGKYMSEANAKVSGARPDHGKACNK